MEKGREGRDSGSEVWGGGKGGTTKEVVVTSMGFGGGGGQEKKTELGGELGREEHRDEGCIRLQDSSEQCQKCSPMHVCESASTKKAVFMQWNSS